MQPGDARGLFKIGLGSPGLEHEDLAGRGAPPDRLDDAQKVHHVADIAFVVVVESNLGHWIRGALQRPSWARRRLFYRMIISSVQGGGKEGGNSVGGRK